LTRLEELERVGFMTDLVPMKLSTEDVERVIEALDAYEYWQLGDVLPRNNGAVFIPGDLEPGFDRYWDGEVINEDQRRAIEEVVACRALAERLREADRENTVR
jgi:hypothetical protein